jgi:hypothetical protein
MQVGGLQEGGTVLTYEGPLSFATGAGPARALRWSRGEGTNEAVVFVPVCDRQLTLVVFASGGGFEVMSGAQRWLRSLHFDEQSPACRFVKEDRPRVGR